MYHSDKPYEMIPNVLFFLKENGRELDDYKKIEASVDSFKGRLIWAFRRAFYSKKNYVIMPKIIYQIKTDGMSEDKMEIGDARKVLGDKRYNEICEKAIEDIPDLHRHMKKNL